MADVDRTPVPGGAFTKVRTLCTHIAVVGEEPRTTLLEIFDDDESRKRTSIGIAAAYTSLREMMYALGDAYDVDESDLDDFIEGVMMEIYHNGHAPGCSEAES